MKASLAAVPPTAAVWLACSWIEPRQAAVQSLTVQLRCPDRLPVVLSPHFMLPVLSGDDRPPLPLARLAIGCPAEVSMQDYGARLASLTRLELSQCSFEADRLQTVAVLPPPLMQLQRLLELELCDGTLLGDLSANKRPWLPPSLTSLALCNAGLRELPGVLRFLPALRRWALACVCVAPGCCCCRPPPAACRPLRCCCRPLVATHPPTCPPSAPRAPSPHRSLSVAQNRLAGHANLGLLPGLARTLEELNLSEASMRAFPTQVRLLGFGGGGGGSEVGQPARAPYRRVARCPEGAVG